MKDLKNILKERLENKVFDADTYSDKLIELLSDLNVVADTVNFDIDRIYKKDYDRTDEYGNSIYNWEDFYICSLDTTFKGERLCF